MVVNGGFHDLVVVKDIPVDSEPVALNCHKTVTVELLNVECVKKVNVFVERENNVTRINVYPMLTDADNTSRVYHYVNLCANTDKDIDIIEDMEYDVEVMFGKRKVYCTGTGGCHSGRDVNFRVRQDVFPSFKSYVNKRIGRNCKVTYSH